MISWVVIVILLILGIFAIKLNHLRHRFFIIFLIILALFLYTTMSLVNTQNNLDFTTAKGLSDAGKIYTGWLANGFSNLRAITGSAVSMDWGSTNGTFFSNKSLKSKGDKKSKG